MSLKKEDLVMGQTYKFNVGPELIQYIGKEGVWFQFTLKGHCSEKVWAELLEENLNLIHEVN